MCFKFTRRLLHSEFFFRFTIFRIYLCYRINLALVTIVLCREDILVFLTGQEEIESTVRNIREISKELQTGRCYYQNIKNIFISIFHSTFFLPTARECNVFSGVCHSVHNRPRGYSVTAHPCYSAIGTHPIECFLVNTIALC